MICGSGGSKSRLAKAAGAEPSGQMRDEKLHAVVARSTFPSQNVQVTHHVRTTFGSWDVQTVHAVVSGAKHISKSKCTSNTPRSDHFLEVEMFKKCPALWREAHVQIKMYKAPHVGNTFGSWDVEKVDASVVRSTFPSQHVKSTTCSDHLWRFRCGFAWQVQGLVHLVKSVQNLRVLYQFHLQPPLHYNTLHFTTLH